MKLLPATVSGGLSASNQLIATKSARYWAAFRSNSSLAIRLYKFLVSVKKTLVVIGVQTFLGLVHLTVGAVKIIGDPNTDNNTITVDGGEWTGSDGSGTPDSQTTLVKKLALRQQADGC